MVSDKLATRVAATTAAVLILVLMEYGLWPLAGVAAQAAADVS